MIFSLVGIYAIREGLRNLLFCYLISLIIILILQIAFASSLYSLSSMFTFQQQVVSGALVDQSDITINNVVFSVYTQCCSGCPLGCNNPISGSYSDMVLPNCLNQTCNFIGACGSKTQDKCFNFNGVPTDDRYIPPNDIALSVCTALSSLSYMGSPLVGPVSGGGCGYGDARLFHVNLALYMSSNMYGAAAVVAFLVALEVLSFLICIYIIFCVRKTSFKTSDAGFQNEGYLDNRVNISPQDIVSL